MDFPKDPIMLLSFINLKLRDEFSSLAELCRAYDADESEIKDKLASAGYEYKEDLNQFR